ncbi:MAG: aminoglycoside phosphotransferase family protein [Nitrospirota bacterium]
MIDSIISHFSVSSVPCTYKRFGAGLIHDTYLCECKEGGTLHQYILQRINTAIFPHPQQIMSNIQKVTEHLTKKLQARGIADPFYMTPTLVLTKSGETFYPHQDGTSWRMFHFIQRGIVVDFIQNRQHAYEVGRGLGAFQAELRDLNPSVLYETLPGFHTLPAYFAEYESALKGNPKNRVKEVEQETLFIFKRRDFISQFEQRLKSGNVPIRIVHYDPKVNNIMLRQDTHTALCMLDLDTVMPGYAPLDFGDCVRSAANPAGEDELDLSKVTLHLPFFEAITSGYFLEARSFLTHQEIEMLPDAAKAITFELGLRFLADYLRGDTYFKVQYPTHNKDRARVQFKLLESMEASEDQMRQIVTIAAGEQLIDICGEEVTAMACAKKCGSKKATKKKTAKKKK